MHIGSIAVIGSGVMGGGIAAQFANSGVSVLLLDIVSDAARASGDRSAVAAAAVARLMKAAPAPFMNKTAQRLVTPGNIEDDLPRLAGVDWIVEAVVEDLPSKHELYTRLEPHRRPGSIISSNTSTIPLHMLVAGRSQEFRQNFLVTHFFNPPRYMRLLEIVAGSDTSSAVVDAVRGFADVRLGKGVVDCQDTPGFIANRIGTYWIDTAIRAAIDLGLTVEEADQIAGRPMGLPKTGVFGLMDLVGIDLMPLIIKSFRQTLPASDPFLLESQDLPLLVDMIASGRTGRKGRGGFYRRGRAADGNPIREVLDLSSGEYRPQARASLESAAARDLRSLVSHPDKGGHFAWQVLSRTLSYAADLVPEIAQDIAAVDQAMCLGYSWRRGPFAMIDQLGSGWFTERLAAEGRPLPRMLRTAGGQSFYRVVSNAPQILTVDGAYAPLPRSSGVLLLADLRRVGAPLIKTASAAVWDIGEGVLCLEFTSKMNTIDADTLGLLQKTIETIESSEGKYKALVLYNEGENFSVGANLGMIMFAANVGAWPMIEEQIVFGQKVYQSLKYAPFPVIGAPAGRALGGGCEILLHAAAIQAHAESYIGLVEVGVGVVPGWGGCKEMLLRTADNSGGGPMPPVRRAFEMIGTAKVSTSAAEAREMGILSSGDGITMNRDRLLFDAREKALAMVENYRPPQPPRFRLPGSSGKAALMLAVADLRLQGQATAHDVVVSEALATILTGGVDGDPTVELNEAQMLDLERVGFMHLLRTDGSMARIEHMLDTGKPLRN